MYDDATVSFLKAGYAPRRCRTPGPLPYLAMGKTDKPLVGAMPTACVTGIRPVTCQA